MNTTHLKRILLGLAVVIGCVLCAIIGFFIGGGLGVNASAGKSEGLDWLPLGKPSVPIQHLLFVSPYDVGVETSDGKVFLSSIDCSSEPCWAISDPPDLDPASWVGENLFIGETCEFAEQTKAPPGSVSECAMNTLAMPGGYETEYLVLLDDGTVWVWTNGAYDIDYGIGLFSLFIYGLLGIVISVAVYSIFIIVFYLLRKKLSAPRGKPLHSSENIGFPASTKLVFIS